MVDEQRYQRVVTGFFAAFAAAAALFKLSSYDLWWHLATGRYMAAGNGIPRADPFSHTAQGVAWIDHEWLFQLVVHSTHQIAGTSGLVLLRMALITAIALFGLAALHRLGRFEIAAAALLMVPFILSGRDRFLLRPELFTMLFAALLLTRFFGRDAPPSLFRDWWLVPLFALWANLHAGLIVGVVLLMAMTVGRVAEGLPFIGAGEPLSKRQLIEAGALVVAATAAGLVNPFFHLVYVTPFELTALIESGIYDNLEWRRPGLQTQWLFYVVVAVVLIAIISKLKQRRWTAILPLLFLVLISLRYVRNIGIFGLLTPILLAAILAPSDDRRRLAGIRPRLAIPVLLFLSVWLVVAGHHFPTGFGIDPKRVPEGGVDFLEQHRPSANLYNSYGFGGYVSWRLWPEVETFIDGRNEVFKDIRGELGEAVGDSRLWTALLDDHGVNTVLVSWGKKLEQVTLMDPDGGPPTTAWWPYTATHFPRSRWALVHWDDNSAVYLRRAGPDQELIREFEVHHVYPGDADYQLWALTSGRADLGRCMAELGAKLAADPDCRRAQHLYDRIVGDLAGPAG